MKKKKKQVSSRTEMRENNSIITKFTPNWIPTKKCEEKSMDSYSLDFTQCKCIGSEKVFVMNVSFILNGRYLLTVQRRTKDLVHNSTFQVVLWEAKEVKNEVENKRLSQQQLVVPMNDDIVWKNQTFDLDFTDIHQVHILEGRKLVIVGRVRKDVEVLEQYNFLLKEDSDKVRMKRDFTLNFSSRCLAVKKNVSPVFRGLDFPDNFYAVVYAVASEGDLTSFVFEMSSFSAENRWVVCLYNGQAKRSSQQFHFIELSNIIRGRITSACLLKNGSKLVLVTDAFQLLSFDIEKTSLSLRNIRLLNNESFKQDEDIHLQKINYACLESNVEKELIIACSSSGRLFFVPESLNSFNTEIHSLDVSSGIDEKIYVEQFASCDFTKQCILICRSGRVYTFDIFRKSLAEKTNIFNTEMNSNLPCVIGSDFYYQPVELNWFGDELYHLQDNVLNVHLMRPSQTEESKRTKILENLPVEDIMRSNISTYVKRIIS